MNRVPASVWLLGGATSLGVLIVNVYPMIALAVGSVSTKSGFGFDHYVELFTKFSLGGVMLNSWIYALGTSFFALAIGVSMAVLVARTDIPGKGAIRLATVLAFVSPPWLTAMAYVFLASPNAGLINQLLHMAIGVKPFNIQSLSGMIFVSALFLYSFVFLTVESALASVDGAYEEAARTSGASRLQVVMRVTVPLVMPSIVASGVFSLIISWGLFATPAILGIPSRIYVFATQLYLFLQSFPPRLEVAAAMGMMFCLSAFLLGLAVWLVRRRFAARRFAVIAGKGRKPALLPLGRARLPAAIACWAVSTLAVILPAAMILFMSLNTSWFGQLSLANLSLANFIYVLTEYPNTALVIGNTLTLATIEAAITLTLGIAVAYLLTRTPWIGRLALTGAASYTVLIPSVAFVTGVIWAWIKSPLPLYGTLLLIALAQAARSLPIAVRNLRDGFGQIDGALEEAAIVCGARRFGTFLRVTLPLLRYVLLGTFTIVFLSSLRDLNTPLFLGAGSTETLTLSVLIFQFWSESRAGESAALTILLLVMTLAIFLPIYRLVPRAE